VITGVGFTEIITILVLVLLFFGSKEIPTFVREAGRLLAKLRRYSEQVRRELDDVARSADPEVRTAGQTDTVREKKQELRERFLAARTSLSDQQRREMSDRIARNAMELKALSDARAVMVYLNTRTEVATDTLVARLRQAGKRIVIPYVREISRDLGIAEVRNEDEETSVSVHNIREPLPEIRENFLKSDISVVVCPGVAFDRRGARVGRGKGYYDNFLRELSGRVPFVGLAFNCQISDEPFPFDYHDVPMTSVVTEQGVLNAAGSAAPARD
jgi:5-formyltetrahydrofolate cyclo-ligase